jgi:uncharacterized protein YpmS
MRIITTILMVIGAIGILFGIAIVMGVLLYSLSPPIKSQIAEVPVSADAVENFDEQYNTFQKEVKTAVENKEEKQFQLSISEEELNSKIVALLAEGKLPMKELSVNLIEDYAWIYMTTNNPSIDAKMGIIAQLNVFEGDIEVTVVEFQLGRLPLPHSIDEWASSIITIIVKMQDPSKDMKLELTDIMIEDGDIIFQGKTEAP